MLVKIRELFHFLLFSFSKETTNPLHHFRFVLFYRSQIKSVSKQTCIRCTFFLGILTTISVFVLKKKEEGGIILFFRFVLFFSSVVVGFFHNLWPFFSLCVCHLLFSRTCLLRKMSSFRRQCRYDHLTILFFSFSSSSSSSPNCWHNTTTKFRTYTQIEIHIHSLLNIAFASSHNHNDQLQHLIVNPSLFSTYLSLSLSFICCYFKIACIIYDVSHLLKMNDYFIDIYP